MLRNYLIIIYFFLLIIVSSINNNSINNIKFNKTQNIHVSGLSEKDNQILLNEIKNLNLKTILVYLGSVQHVT